MSKNRTQKWREVKAKIILRYGSIGECARALRCSDEAIRQTVDGRCRRVAKRLEAALS